MKSQQAIVLGLIIASVVILFTPSISFMISCGIDTAQNEPYTVVYGRSVTLSPAQYLFFQGNGERLTDSEGVVCGSA